MTVAVDNLRRWKNDPRIFVREVFAVEPDPWQDDVLEAFPHQPRVAMAASKGPGKTTTLAWLAWNFLLTRPHPKIAATSITGDNLADGLWTEMSKWQQKSALLKSAFTWNKTRIFANDHPETWWMSARSWPKKASAEEQAATLAGLHAEYILFLIDESGSIPPAVLIAAEAALATGTESHVIQAGNTTDTSGMLYEACVTNRSKWYVVPVSGDPDDPKRSPRVSKAWAQDLIDRYGRDSPYVMVNVLGQFPRTSFASLLSLDDIKAAQGRSYRESDIYGQPRILGVDVALFGGDASVIFPRQGLVAFAPERHRNIEPHLGASRVSARWGEWEPDAVFVDNTGGYGASWISHLRLMGREPIGVGFAESPNDPQFLNKRAEIYWNCAKWIRDGGQLPPASVPGMTELTRALTETTYTTKRDKLMLEPKELVTQRIQYSPDDADALCLTFSHPVSPRAKTTGRPKHRADWDFGALLHQANQTFSVGRMAVEHDPFGSF